MLLRGGLSGLGRGLRRLLCGRERISDVGRGWGGERKGTRTRRGSEDMGKLDFVYGGSLGSALLPRTV